MTKVGFVPDSIAASGMPQRPPIQLAGGQQLDLGDIALARGGVIAGRVLDPSGDPVGNARVVALRHLPQGTSTNLAFAPAGPSAQTNDLGEFRVFGLASGEYIVAASLSGINAASTAKTVLTTTYFPSTPDQNSATTVTVTAPDAVNGLEIRLASVPAFRVTGVVVDANGAPVAGAMIMLMPASRLPVIMGPTGNIRSGPNGGFVVGGVPAGTYRAQASPMIPNGRGGVSFSFSSAPGMPQGSEVVVTDADVSGVRIVIQAR